MRDVRGFLVYLHTLVLDNQHDKHNLPRGALVDHYAAERAKRAEAYARRYEELMDLLGTKRYPYDESPAQEKFERIARRATIFDAVE
jgi:hypothetical protein